MTRAAALAVTTLLLTGATLAAACDRGPKAPLYACNSADNSCQGTQYTVVFRDSVADPTGLTEELARRYEFSTVARWATSMKGFSASLESKTVERLRRDAHVAYIQQGNLARSY